MKDILTVAAILTSLLLSSCKKGESDPSICKDGRDYVLTGGELNFIRSVQKSYPLYQEESNTTDTLEYLFESAIYEDGADFENGCFPIALAGELIYKSNKIFDGAYLGWWFWTDTVPNVIESDTVVSIHVSQYSDERRFDEDITPRDRSLILEKKIVNDTIILIDGEEYQGASVWELTILDLGVEKKLKLIFDANDSIIQLVLDDVIWKVIY